MVLPLLSITVLSTWIAGYYDESIPYFPIELSRTASGPVSRWVFSIGITVCSTLFLSQVWYWPKHERPFVFVAVFGLLLLAWVNDTLHLNAHIAGVIIMGISTFAFVFIKRPQHTGLVLTVMLLWINRYVMKLMMVSYYEGGGTEVMTDIMFTGQVKNPDTLVVFKITGVLQWIVFIMLIPVYF